MLSVTLWSFGTIPKLAALGLMQEVSSSVGIVWHSDTKLAWWVLVRQEPC